MNLRHLFHALVAAAALGAAQARALDLRVEVSGARSDKGHVMAAIYADAASWMKQALHGERVVAGERTLLVFRNLAPGTYALAVFHDENGNGVLDRNLVGLPTEPYGFSRDARAMMSAPKFEAAALPLQADTTIVVTLQ